MGKVMNVRTFEMSCSTDRARSMAWILSSAAVLQVVCGGIRFVDGSMLLQFSQTGFQANLQEFSQYLFDSPLKILLLWTLHLNNALVIGFLFLTLNFLPMLAVLLVGKDEKERIELFAVASIMPIFKLMFQNTGVGDSVIIAGTIVLVAGRHWLPVAVTACVMVLWHFQQGVLIVSVLFALFVVMRSPDWRLRLKALAIGTMTGVLAFAAIETFLVPRHVGRLGYIFAHVAPFLRQNLLYLPIALCPILPGTILMTEALQARDQRGETRITLAAITATALALCVGMLTTDFSRTMLLLTFPVVLFLTKSASPVFSEMLRTPHRVGPLLAIGVVTPLFSWSGIDIFLWTTLQATFQKYLGGAL
jgi:hypothetical protein